MTLVTLCAVLVLGATPPAAVQADPREQLTTAVAHGIKLLEAKDHLRFMKEFISPDDMKKVLGSRPEIDATMAQKFGEQKAPLLLEALKDAQKGTPRYDAEGVTAVYPLKTPIGGREVLAFVKVGKLWYIRN